MTAKYACTTIAVLLAAAIMGGCVPGPEPEPIPPPPEGKAVSEVTVLTQATGPVNRDATVVFGVAFDQPVTGFDDAATDAILMHEGTSGGSTAIFPISAQSYVVVVTGVDGDGEYRLLVPGGAAQDDLGNLNPAGLSAPVLVDNTPPQIVLIGTQVPDGRIGVGANVDLLVDFSEPVTLEGGFEMVLNTGQPVGFSGFALLARVSGLFTVQDGDNADPLDIAAIRPASGARMFDAAGNVGQIRLPAQAFSNVHNIIVDTTPPVVGMAKMSTNSLANLKGTVNDTTAAIAVTVNGASYSAVNNGDGTWSLANLVEPVLLADGTYDVTITASDTVGNIGTATVTGGLTLDGTPPVVIVTRQTTYDHTPTLTGAVDDASATVRVTVAGQTHLATNNRNGTWTLDGFKIDPPLANGTYDIVVEATDPAGNVGRDTTTNELIIDG